MENLIFYALFLQNALTWKQKEVLLIFCQKICDIGSNI